MSDFKAKTHPLGLCLGPRWRSLQRSPDHVGYTYIGRGLLLRGEEGGYVAWLLFSTTHPCSLYATFHEITLPDSRI